MNENIVLFGCGKMGFALFQGWARQEADLSRFVIMDPAISPQVAALAEEKGACVNPPDAAIAAPRALVLAIKPQMLEAVSSRLAAVVGPETLILSILAGKTIASLRVRAPLSRAVIRAMPNTPAAVGSGITAAFANSDATPEQKKLAQHLLQAVGSVIWLEDENLIDAATAISGSGPAYVFYLAECLSAAARTLGLSADVAETLARATIAGAGDLLRASPDLSPAQLRENVTSPGGTTSAALAVLMDPDRGLAPLMQKTACAAELRAKQLAD